MHHQYMNNKHVKTMMTLKSLAGLFPYIIYVYSTRLKKSSPLFILSMTIHIHNDVQQKNV